MTIYAWLYRLALDTLIDMWRHENREARDPHDEIPWPDRSSMQLGLNLVGNLTNPHDAALRDELRGRVREAMDALKPEDREILAMRHFDDLPYREAGMVLGISEDAATKRYARALLRFKALWLALNPPSEGMTS